MADTLIGTDYLTSEQLAKELQLSRHAIYKLAMKRVGPPRLRLGKRFVYRRESVRAWLESREVEQQGCRKRGSRR